MPQLGSEDKPVLMTNKKNGGRIGKGSRPRPITNKEQFAKNWDMIFNKGTKSKD
jgi:hypothetical protein